MSKCKKCGTTLSEEDECFLGYCEKCYNQVYDGDKEYNTSNTSYEYDNRNINSVARIIKILAIISAVISIIGGIFFFGDSEPGMGIVCLIGGIISSIFVYSLGEIIQLLEDIKNK